MGKGNFIPYNPRDEHGYTILACEFFYVEIETNGYDNEDIYNYMLQVIRECLPNTFKEETYWYNNDECVIAQNQLIEVAVGDNGWGYAIVVREREVDNPARHFAARYVHKLYVRLRNTLFERGFKLSLRRDAWTCTPITRKLEEESK
jgi:hypothetical protein